VTSWVDGLTEIPKGFSETQQPDHSFPKSILHQSIVFTAEFYPLLFVAMTDAFQWRGYRPEKLPRPYGEIVARWAKWEKRIVVFSLCGNQVNEL
jgi:hypothetical protein